MYNIVVISINVSSAFNPKLKRKERRPVTGPDGADAEPEKNNDKIDLFGDNPEWEPGWVKAYRVNAAGQVDKNIKNERCLY